MAPVRAPRSPSWRGARALAFLRGRDYVLPPDLGDLALDVLRHRLVLSYEALADDVDPDTVVTRVLSSGIGPARGAAGSVTVVTAPDRLLHHLEWHVLRRLEGRLNGAYRTNQRGAGVDLAGLREYVDTDDARRIDWSATARTGETSSASTTRTETSRSGSSSTARHPWAWASRTAPRPTS